LFKSELIPYIANRDPQRIRKDGKLGCKKERTLTYQSMGP
jgi:hypothetical protein